MRLPASAIVKKSRTCQKVSNRRGENKFSHRCVSLLSSIASRNRAYRGSQLTVKLHHTIRLICIFTEGLRF